MDRSAVTEAYDDNADTLIGLLNKWSKEDKNTELSSINCNVYICNKFIPTNFIGALLFNQVSLVEKIKVDSVESVVPVKLPIKSEYLADVLEVYSKYYSDIKIASAQKLYNAIFEGLKVEDNIVNFRTKFHFLNGYFMQEFFKHSKGLVLNPNLFQERPDIKTTAEFIDDVSLQIGLRGVEHFPDMAHFIPILRDVRLVLEAECPPVLKRNNAILPAYMPAGAAGGDTTTVPYDPSETQTATPIGTALSDDESSSVVVKRSLSATF